VIHPDPQAANRREPLPLQDARVGKLNVNCGMLGGKDCQWGKLEGADAGVLKFLTSLNQGKGYRLDQVTVNICFAEHGPNDDEANTALILLKPPYPTNAIPGEQRKERVLCKRAVCAKVQALGGGGELGGIERIHETEFVRSWYYSCIWCSDRHGKYTAAEWKWEADEGDPRVRHVSRLYSGVVVGHLHRPFWVGCKIQPLLSYSDPLRRLKRYMGRPSIGGDKYTFVEVPLGPTDTNPETNLETVVSGLDEEIAQLMGSNPKQKETRGEGG